MISIGYAIYRGVVLTPGVSDSESDDDSSESDDEGSSSEINNSGRNRPAA
jgi:hypothetical protein